MFKFKVGDLIRKEGLRNEYIVTLIVKEHVWAHEVDKYGNILCTIRFCGEMVYPSTLICKMHETGVLFGKRQHEALLEFCKKEKINADAFLPSITPRIILKSH